MVDTRSKATVVQIAGAGHNGSTLLGLILGGHSSAFYLGEAKKAPLVGRADQPNEKRACKYCGEQCPVWGDYRWRKETNLFQEMSQRTGARLLIDSSNDLPWIREQGAGAEAAGLRRVLLFLQRDGRAVLSSRLRKYPGRPIDAQIDQWVERTRATTRYYHDETIPKMVVRYEELCLDPYGVVRRICELLDVPFEEQMLDYSSTKHHVLGGNNGTQSLADTEGRLTPSAHDRQYYEAHPGGILLDLRWLSELSKEARELFERRAGSVNHSLRWDAPS